MKTKKFNWDDTKPSITYRPGTSDEAIINAVLINRQEYNFPTFKPEVVFDVGANIGVVSVVLANIYPDAKIYSFEPVQENIDLLRLNTLPYPNVKVLPYGLGNSSGQRRIYDSDDPTNLGGFSTKIKVGDGRLIDIKDVSCVCQEFGTPDLIKIDVEGAEDEIFTSMPNLDKVRWIAGELHGVNDYKLLDLLNKNFRLQIARNFDDKVWHFHALARDWTSFGLDPSLQ